VVLSSEKKDVGLGRVAVVVDPADAHLNPERAPFFFREKMVPSVFAADLFGKDDMPVLVNVVVVLV
jgi:hypothetical protein